ncbi:hypothetical protein [Kutzneria albida]|uniref:hypothetical protein n=1 Tax=Kutzneria albida TaxID=43357 RepID=UPI00046CC0DA|nr:hypothetical protein [Kutzneria albida]
MIPDAARRVAGPQLDPPQAGQQCDRLARHGDSAFLAVLTGSGAVTRNSPTRANRGVRRGPVAAGEQGVAQPPRSTWTCGGCGAVLAGPRAGDRCALLRQRRVVTSIDPGGGVPPHPAAPGQPARVELRPTNEFPGRIGAPYAV